MDIVLSVEGKYVIVGVGTKGATVNVCEHNGLKGQIHGSAMAVLCMDLCSPS